MDYKAIIARSVEITTKNKFMWWLGALAAITNGGSSLLSSSDSSWRSDQSAPLADVAKTAATWAGNHVELLIIVGSIIFLIYAVLIYLSFVANAGLIVATNELETSSKALGFKKSFAAGRPFAWPLFGLSLTLIVGLLFATVLAGIIIAFGIAAGSAFLPIALLFGFICVVAVVLISAYLTALIPLAERTIVLKNVGVSKAIAEAHTLIRHQASKVFVSWLISVGIGLLTGIISFVLVMTIGFAAICVGFILLAATSYNTTIGFSYAIFVGIMAIIVGVVVSGIYATFFSTYWTLCYRAIRHLHTNK